jgi:hypothetical protein
MRTRAQHSRGQLRWRTAITCGLAWMLMWMLMWTAVAEAKKPRAKRRRAKATQSTQGTQAPGSSHGSLPSSSSRAASDIPAQAQGEVRDERGTKVKVIRFTGLDISGKLKSPQMLYFLNRMHAEFDRPRLPHRSFVGEIETSASKKPLR